MSGDKQFRVVYHWRKPIGCSCCCDADHPWHEETVPASSRDAAERIVDELYDQQDDAKRSGVKPMREISTEHGIHIQATAVMWKDV